MATVMGTIERGSGPSRPTELSATKLRDIMTTDVLTLAQDQTLREAVDALSESGVSGAPVSSGGRVVGVISTSDILDFAASTSPVPGWEAEWGEPGLRPGAEDEPAPALFYTDADWAMDAHMLDGLATGTSEWDLLDECTVGEVMTRRLEALPPDADAASASRMMLNLGIHRVLVMENGELKGIVSTMDILGLFAERRG